MKEWFKSKPYWLKGGIILVSIYLILIILTLIIVGIDCSGEFCFPGWIILSIPAMMIIQSIPFIVEPLESIGSEVKILFFVASGLSIILYFIIGAITGWIIGKIKSKNN